MSRRRPSRARPTRRDAAARGHSRPPVDRRDAAGPPEDKEAHPTDPTRTRSGRFRRDFVHNETGRRGKRARKRDDDLAALLRSIATEPLEGSHPTTGEPLTVIEGLVRAVFQKGFKEPKIGLALLELMVRTGALPMSAPDGKGSADQDAATLQAFLGRALRQERARAARTPGEESRP